METPCLDMEGRRGDSCRRHAARAHMTNSKDRAIIADALPSDFLEYGKGGHQGYVETPTAYNILVESVMDCVQDWNRRRVGFSIDDVFVNHFAWADNVWLVASSESDMQSMVAQLS
eukprot:9485943-Pyramimonas_sp.AAC.1